MLDRRVKVLGIKGDYSLRRVSDLRSDPFVVLLGEPGIGKSTVLRTEAAHEAAPVLTVRALMTGTGLAPAGTLYLDALDEYRIDGQRADKVHNLAGAIARVRSPRWRLTCRAEDWRKEPDLAAIRGAASGAEIVVAQLVPLNVHESAQVLRTLGANNPEEFIARAQALGASGFLESPLSVRLLYKAVSESGQWPSNRYDLYASAIQRLAHEHNIEHKGGPRKSVHEIVAAAETACLVLLLSGSGVIWRSHAQPPAGGGDSRAYLSAYDLGVDAALIDDMVDSSLFRGEGEEFEPMHRTVAEYLGGRALAQAVRGKDRGAIPLGRATALITGIDHLPPTELRGLYAWFAAHLAKLGQGDAANQLIEADAATVLMYGDAGTFSTPQRRAILLNLGQKDPFFRDYEVADTTLGSLAGSDLTQDFIDILSKPSDPTHCLATVFEVLTSGPAVEGVRPLLRSIALDAGRAAWQRRSAAAAWLNGAPSGAVRDLFDALSPEPVSPSREELRVYLATLLPASSLSVTDVRSVIRDFESTPSDNIVGRLVVLSAKLRETPPVELFDVPLASWLPKSNERQHSVELDQFFDALLAASIEQTPTLSADRLWRWTRHVRHRLWDSLHEESADALRSWLAGDSSREIEFFAALVRDLDPNAAPWEPGNAFNAVTGRLPSDHLIRHLLERACTDPPPIDSRRLLAIAVELVRRHPDDAIYAHTRALMAARPQDSDLLQHLEAERDITAAERRAEQEQTRSQEIQQQHDNYIQILEPLVPEISVGKHPKYLHIEASRYFARPNRRNATEPTGFARVVSDTNPIIAAAIDAGWRYLATKELIGVDARLMGTLSAGTQRYFVELPAAAGIDRLLSQRKTPDLGAMPISGAIAVLNSSSWFDTGTTRQRLETWAIERLNVDPAGGADQLLDFWGAALDAGATYLETLPRLETHPARGGAITRALDRLLSTRASMPHTVLHQALRAAAKHLNANRILDLAQIALADPYIIDASRRAWSVVAFALDPHGQRNRFLREHSGQGSVALLQQDLRNFGLGLFEPTDPGARAERASVIVRMVGPLQSPEHNPPPKPINEEEETDFRDIIHAEIRGLSLQPTMAAGHALNALVLDQSLLAWQLQLRHAHATWARNHRERTFRYPTPADIREAITDGPPVNAADLKAVVIEELMRLRRELRSDITPWKRYWNLNSDGNPTDPLIENECRDHLMELLRVRLERYRITAALPETRRSEGTRVDIFILSGAGRNLPIEAKRHFNAEVWDAPGTQLQGYANSEGADRLGVYLVFWFGNDEAPTTARDDGKPGPNTAEELEAMLVADLSSENRELFSVVVFDVSRPGMAGGKPRKKRVRKEKSSKATPAAT